jgi:hypothetical protein
MKRSTHIQKKSTPYAEIFCNFNRGVDGTAMSANDNLFGHMIMDGEWNKNEKRYTLASRSCNWPLGTQAHRLQHGPVNTALVRFQLSLETMPPWRHDHHNLPKIPSWLFLDNATYHTPKVIAVDDIVLCLFHRLIYVTTYNDFHSIKKIKGFCRN